MVTHDAPGPPYQSPRVAHVCATNPQGWSRIARSYAAVGRNRITTIVEAAAPALLFHGHYHVHDTAEVVLGSGTPCTIHSLGADQQAGNLTILNLDTLTAHPPSRRNIT